MKRKVVTVICLSAGLLCWAAPGSGAEEVKRKTIEDYGLLVQRNIFSRERHAIDTSRAAEVAAPVDTRTPQSYYVLRGVAKQKDAVIAFLENTGTLTVSRVKEGESVADGRITAVCLDSISYALAGKTVQVSVGMTLEGRVSETLSTSYSVPDSSGQQQNTGSLQNFGQQQNAGAPPSVQSETPAVSTEAAGDILQRLKERRKKELGE